MKTNDLKGLTCFKVQREVARSPLSGISDCLILESSPSPDYYSWNDFPPHIRQFSDRHLYLLVKNKMICFHDVILRYSVAIRKKYKNTLHIYPGWMTFHNEDFQCIRLDTSHTEQIEELINDLRKQALEFFPDRRVGNYTGHIYYKKYIRFLPLDERIFQDADNLHRYFFTINTEASISELQYKTDFIKNNCNMCLFDSFLANLFVDYEFIDFFGIWVHQGDRSRFISLLKEIDKQYMPEQEAKVTR